MRPNDSERFVRKRSHALDMKVEEFVDRFFYKEDLQNLLEREGLPVSGRKNELIERLRRDANYDILQFISSLKKGELEFICEDLDLKTTGTKDELAERVFNEIWTGWRTDYYIKEMRRVANNQGWSKRKWKEFLSPLQKEEVKEPYEAVKLDHDLEKRVRKFKRYETIFGFVTRWAFMGFLLIFVFWTGNIRQFFGREPETWEMLVFSSVGFCMLLVLGYGAGKRMNKYRLEDNEWATFYTHSITSNLQKYSKTTNIELKKDYRKKAVENAKDFLSCIKKRWKIGSFKLAQDYFGKSLSELKKNIEYRVIPFLKDGDDNLLRKIEQVMRNFLAESRSLNLEGINSLNKQMSSGLPTAESMKVGFRDRLLSFFDAHRILKHGLFVLTVFIGCCVFYYMAVSYLEILREYAFTGSVAIFLGLLTIYFRSQPKE